MKAFLSFVTFLVICCIICTEAKSTSQMQQDVQSLESSQEERKKTDEFKMFDLLTSTIWGKTNQKDTSSSSNESKERSDDSWISSSHPDLIKFKNKISERLRESSVFSGNWDMQKRIKDIADEKFNQCKTEMTGVNKSCAGRTTGQMMQLIASVENVRRPRLD